MSGGNTNGHRIARALNAHEIDPVDQTISITWPDADITGTWTGKARTKATDTSAITLTVTMSDTYDGTDTVIGFGLVGSELATLLTGKGEVRFELEGSRTESPVYGLRIPIVLQQRVNR